MAGPKTERAALTRAKLMEAARRLFARDGFAGTGTEAILAAAGVTRGALYHHFRDKADLFEAVCREMHEDAVADIERAVAGVDDPIAALEAGALAWIDAMVRPDVRRVLAIEAPGVLGWARWNALDRQHGYGLLRDGVEAAIAADALEADDDPEDLAVLLNGAMNAAILWAGATDSEDRIARMRAAVLNLIRALRLRALHRN